MNASSGLVHRNRHRSSAHSTTQATISAPVRTYGYSARPTDHRASDHHSTGWVTTLTRTARPAARPAGTERADHSHSVYRGTSTANVNANATRYRSSTWR